MTGPIVLFDALTTRRGRRGIPGTGSVEHSREAALLAMMSIDGVEQLHERARLAFPALNGKRH
jgi:hypothetical protein